MLQWSYFNTPPVMTSVTQYTTPANDRWHAWFWYFYETYFTAEVSNSEYELHRCCAILVTLRSALRVKLLEDISTNGGKAWGIKWLVSSHHNITYKTFGKSNRSPSVAIPTESSFSFTISKILSISSEVMVFMNKSFKLFSTSWNQA